jgi:hypothetical protein
MITSKRTYLYLTIFSMIIIGITYHAAPGWRGLIPFIAGLACGPFLFTLPHPHRGDQGQPPGTQQQRR